MAACASLAVLATLSAAPLLDAEVEATSRCEVDASLDASDAAGLESPSARLVVERKPPKSRGRIRALLASAGMSEIEFVPLENIAMTDALFAWAGHGVIGFVSVEARMERSTDELRDHHLRKFASRCVGRPESKGPRAREVAGYTLLQQTIGCRVEAGFRVIVTTSILDTFDILTFAHVGLAAEAERLEATNRALGEVLLVSLQQGDRGLTRPGTR